MIRHTIGRLTPLLLTQRDIIFIRLQITGLKFSPLLGTTYVKEGWFMVIRVLFLLFLSFIFLTYSSPEVPLKAAFIRDHNLWMKNGEKEILLVKGRNIQSPKWSKDGRFIAYVDGEENGEAPYLYIYDTEQKVSYQPYPGHRTYDFAWSPTSNQLAYTINESLKVTKTENGRPKGFENVATGISSFAWFPNGKEIIASALSKLLPTGWGPVKLFKITVDPKVNGEKIKPFYTIQTNENDLFAIDANHFRWSFDGTWISFLATPTAAMSADSNILCILSTTGKNFQVLGNMLGIKEWTKWSPAKNQLAFINGEGRFWIENKRTALLNIPATDKGKEFTPKGYVDLGIDWFSKNELIVPRAKEIKGWNEGPVPLVFPSLFLINTDTGAQKQITFPREHELDGEPQVVGSHIAWLRTTDWGTRGDIWMKHGIEGSEHLWLKNVDGPPVFYNKK